ncbi:MAG TPA: DUF4097 family beta strand repeat-containing protein [Mycobacteriales bacterium]|nr:DUF4097 family beta strand repeat-containing protein [Mycobacteriales bacterium]
MGTPRRAGLVAAVLSGGLVAASGADAVPSALHHVTTTVPVHGHVTRLVVDDNSGAVTVQAGTTSSVRRSSDWNLIAPKVAQTLHDGTLTVTTRCPNAIPENNCGVDLVVTVPARTRTDVHAAVGHVSLHGMSGDASVDAAVGDVTISHARSRHVTVDSAVGDLRISLARSPRMVRLSSPVGDIQLRVPAGTYDASAVSQLGAAKVRGITRRASSHRHLSARSVTGDVHILGVTPAAG